MNLTPLILFPSLPTDVWKIDFDFADELAAAQKARLTPALVDHTAVLKGDVEAAVARVPKGAGLAIYRGWMLRPHLYEALYEALKGRGVQLINTPEQYKTCHYLPNSYPYIIDYTPHTVWFRTLDYLDEALDLFGDEPVIVKDYVKSQKHYWKEACFIPRASDRVAAEKVVNRFLELQGDDFNEGVVIRQYAPLKIVAHHPKSGTPLADEHRIFWLKGKPVLSARYWGDRVPPHEGGLPWEKLRTIAAQIPSPFFTMDIAFLEDGGWTIVELGDGQVAGLPHPALADDFYRQLRE